MQVRVRINVSGSYVHAPVLNRSLRFAAGCECQVKHTPVHVRTAVIDADPNLHPVQHVRDPHHGPQWKFSVRARERFHVEDFPAGRGQPVKVGTVPGRHALLFDPHIQFRPAFWQAGAGTDPKAHSNQEQPYAASLLSCSPCPQWHLPSQRSTPHPMRCTDPVSSETVSRSERDNRIYPIAGDEPEMIGSGGTLTELRRTRQEGFFCLPGRHPAVRPARSCGRTPVVGGGRSPPALTSAAGRCSRPWWWSATSRG